MILKYIWGEFEKSSKKKPVDKKPEAKQTSNVPKTGDVSHAGVWVMLMTVAVLSGISVIVRRRRARQ